MRRRSLRSDSTSGQELSEWLGTVAKTLDELKIDWVVAGALAAFRYRLNPRFTSDLDLLVRWDERIPTTFEQLGYEVRELRVPGDRPHLVLLRRGDERVDLIVSIVEYQDVAIDRGKTEHVLTVEDVIIHKLIAWRPRDQDDIASILAAGHDLDLDYIDYWAKEWDVADRWAQARRNG
jgi:hypothetical protein